MSTIKSSAENLTLNADGANNDIKFQSNGSEVASIDQAGNVMLKPAGSAVQWQNGYQTITGDSGSNILTYRTYNQHVWKNVTGASSTTDGTERMRLDGSGYLRLAGGGIQFNGDTAAANALDDYEEGTFSPTVFGSTTAGTPTYDDRQGRYTKVGRLVTYQIYIVWSALSGGAGNLRVGGLPFTSAADTYNSVTIYLDRPLTMSANNVAQAYLGVNSTFIGILQYPVGGGTHIEVPVDTNAAFMLQGSYIV